MSARIRNDSWIFLALIREGEKYEQEKRKSDR